MKEDGVKESNKKDSRKFFVWVTWLIVTLAIIILSSVVMIITKETPFELVSLAEKVIGFFFAVSMMYLGVNVGQKMGFAFADALTAKYESEKGDDIE